MYIYREREYLNVRAIGNSDDVQPAVRRHGVFVGSLYAHFESISRQRHARKNTEMKSLSLLIFAF